MQDFIAWLQSVAVRLECFKLQFGVELMKHSAGGFCSGENSVRFRQYDSLSDFTFCDKRIGRRVDAVREIFLERLADNFIQMRIYGDTLRLTFSRFF